MRKLVFPRTVRCGAFLVCWQDRFHLSCCLSHFNLSFSSLSLACLSLSRVLRCHHRGQYLFPCIALRPVCTQHSRLVRVTVKVKVWRPFAQNACPNSRASIFIRIRNTLLVRIFRIMSRTLHCVRCGSLGFCFFGVHACHPPALTPPPIPHPIPRASVGPLSRSLSRRIVREAMVEIMMGTMAPRQQQQQRFSLDDHELKRDHRHRIGNVGGGRALQAYSVARGEAGLVLGSGGRDCEDEDMEMEMETAVSGGLVGRATTETPTRCIMWCAIALGALVKGAPIENVRRED